MKKINLILFVVSMISPSVFAEEQVSEKEQECRMTAAFAFQEKAHKCKKQKKGAALKKCDEANEKELNAAVEKCKEAK
jgi:hypothetical protein